MWAGLVSICRKGKALKSLITNISYLQLFLTYRSYTSMVPVTVVTEGGETDEFCAHFSSWPLIDLSLAQRTERLRLEQEKRYEVAFPSSRGTAVSMVYCNCVDVVCVLLFVHYTCPHFFPLPSHFHSYPLSLLPHTSLHLTPPTHLTPPHLPLLQVYQLVEGRRKQVSLEQYGFFFSAGIYLISQKGEVNFLWVGKEAGSCEDAVKKALVQLADLDHQGIVVSAGV